jgi:hypothetical protein
MTAHSDAENVVLPSNSFVVPPTTHYGTISITVNSSLQKRQAFDDSKDIMVEEALECTAVISSSSTSSITCATTIDESDTTTTSQEKAAAQSSLLSLNDGPSNHHVHVNYVTTQSDVCQEQQIRSFRRSKSTGNLPDAANLPDMSVNALGTTSSFSNDKDFSGWHASDNDTYNCDVGSSIQAITNIAFPVSPNHITAKGPENEDETSSIGSSSSAAYFDLSDFDSSTWRNVVWNHASTTAFGIVTVVALATAAITHPLFFLAASALAAVGTATAAITHRDKTAPSPSSVDAVLNPINKKEVDGKTIQITPSTNTSESTWATCFCIENPFQSKNDDMRNSINQENNEQEIISTIPASGDTKLLFNENIKPTSALRRKLSKDDQTAWVQKHFPRLNHCIGQSRITGKNDSTSASATLVGLNAIDCFRVFFDDGAPFNFLTLQEKRGDLNIQYGLWSSLPMTGKISIFDHKNSMTFPNDICIQSYQGRLLTFLAKTNAMFGPPYAKTTKIQKMLLVNRRLAILENKTTLSGIPFSDRFHVGERWIFASEKVDSKRYVTHVSVECEVFFHQGSCPFEQQIKSKSISTINDVVSSWCIMAVEALKLTERAKLDRLQRTIYDDADDETVDEILTEDNTETETTHDLSGEGSIEVVADSAMLLKRDLQTKNHRPLSSLRGLKHFGRHRHSFDDDYVVRNSKVM